MSLNVWTGSAERLSTLRAFVTAARTRTDVAYWVANSVLTHSTRALYPPLHPVHVACATKDTSPSDELIQQEAVTFCINVSKQQPFPANAVKRLHVPVYDDPNEDIHSHFDRCADAIHQEAASGGRTVVYCKNGRSRSASICIAYLMKHQKLMLADAIQKVKTARHVIEPNPGFLSQLQRYEQELKD